MGNIFPVTPDLVKTLPESWKGGQGFIYCSDEESEVPLQHEADTVVFDLVAKSE